MAKKKPWLLACRDRKKCGHVEPWKGEKEQPWEELPDNRGRVLGKTWLCPECGGRMTLRCGARSGCLRTTSPGRRCAVHGDNVPKGPDSPHWKSGEFSNHTPKALGKQDRQNGNGGGKRYVYSGWRESYDVARFSDEAQRELRHQMALYAALEDDLNRRRETGESKAAWSALGRLGSRIKKLHAEIRDATARQKKAADASDAAGSAKAAADAQRAFADLMELLTSELLPMIEAGVGKTAAERELLKVMDDRRKHFEADVKARERLDKVNFSVGAARLIEVMVTELIEFLPARLSAYLTEEQVRALVGEMLGGLGPKLEIAAQVPGAPPVAGYLFAENLKEVEHDG